MRTKLIAVLCSVTATVATGVLVGAAPSHADVRSRAGTPAKRPTHFAGFPPVGVKVSTPTTGSLVISLRLADVRRDTPVTDWNVYADGRIIWQKWTASRDATVAPKGARRLDTGYLQQRLTLQGEQLLLSKVLATGLFEDNLRLDVGRGHTLFLYQVRRGDRMVTVEGHPTHHGTNNFTKATPTQLRALAEIAALVADPARWLPATVWAYRQVRAFVPSHYMIAVDRSYPDISKLPRSAGRVLSEYKLLRRDGCQALTTGQARALLQAFVKAGIEPSDNHAGNIGFDFHGLGLPHPSYLHLSPALPDDVWNGLC